jgi:predicted deacylase
MAEVSVLSVTAELEAGGEVRVPYWEATSGRPGPRLLVVAAQHGCEVQGSEACRRLIAQAAGELRQGSLVVVPFTNPLSLRRRRHNLNSGPEIPNSSDNSHNLNCLWPGDPAGNDTQRLAAALFNTVVADATHCLDMHCWTHFWAAGVLPHLGSEESCRLAEISGFPLAFPWRLPDLQADPPPTRFSIGPWFALHGRTSLSFELAGQYQIREPQVQLGLRCALNYCRYLGLLPGEPEGTEPGPVWVDRTQVAKVTAPHSGLFVRAGHQPGGWVSKGDKLGHLLSESDLSTTEMIAPVSGPLVSYDCHRRNCDVALPDQHPYADEGDELAAIFPQ